MLRLSLAQTCFQLSPAELLLASYLMGMTLDGNDDFKKYQEIDGD